MEPAGSGAKGGDCRDHAGHRGVIPEARTEASAKVWGTLLSCTVLEPQFQQNCKLETRALFSVMLALLFLVFFTLRLSPELHM